MQEEHRPQGKRKSVAQTGSDCCASAHDLSPMTQERELREASRAVANAKLNEYRRQCWRLVGLVRTGTVAKQAAVDHLAIIATAHALVRSLGEDRIEAIITEAFAGAPFDYLRSEGP